MSGNWQEAGDAEGPGDSRRWELRVCVQVSLASGTSPQMRCERLWDGTSKDFIHLPVHARGRSHTWTMASEAKELNFLIHTLCIIV